MANAGPDTNGSQFFMAFKDSDFEPDYTPFGSVLSGLEVLEKIGSQGNFIGSSGSLDAPLSLERKVDAAASATRR